MCVLVRSELLFLLLFCVLSVAIDFVSLSLIITQFIFCNLFYFIKATGCTVSARVRACTGPRIMEMSTREGMCTINTSGMGRCSGVMEGGFFVCLFVCLFAMF